MTLTLKALVTKKVIRTYNYQKNDSMKNSVTATKTGLAIVLNQCDNLAVIDVDITHSYDETKKQDVRKPIVDKLIAVDNQWPIALTARGGLHIYCLDNDFAQELNLDVNKNRFVKAIKAEDFEVDLFSSRTTKDKRSLVMTPGSTVKIDGQELKYQWLNGSWTSEVKHSVIETLDLLGWEMESSTDNLIESLLDDIEARNNAIDYDSIDGDDVSPEQAIECSVVQKKPRKELLDVLVEGYEGVPIHSTLTDSMDVECAWPNLYASILWMQEHSTDITDEDVDNAAKRILAIADLNKTHLNCKATQRSKTADGVKLFESGKQKGYGPLKKGIRVKKPKYYDEVVVPLLKQLKSNEDEPTFRTSPYTIEDFHKDFSTFKRPYQLVSKLCLCVAINTHGGYIIKQRSNNVIEFQHIKRTELDNSIGGNELVYDTTEEEKQQMKEQKKAVKDKKAIKIKQILTSSLYYDKFEKFDGIELISESSNVLQLYQPPAKTEYDEGLIADWIEFMKSLINNPIAFDELLDSNAYRFRHPTEFIEKFFINYGEGHNGKSYLVACLEKLYPNYANVAVRQDQIENDTFNAWTVKNLLLWMEEAQKSNYQSQAIQQRIKQLTTIKASARGMYSETKNARNWAIVGMNTNSKDLYGLVRADDATLSRLVIIDFKPRFLSEEELHSKCKSFIDNPNFGYSLYHYLAEVRVINPRFTPVRYYGDDKRQIIERMTMANRNSVEDWFAECHEDVIRTAKVNKVECKYMYETDANVSYAAWRSTQSRSRMCMNSIKNSMIDMGFEYKNKKENGKPVHTWRITAVKYDELIKKLNPVDDEDDEEWEDVDETANNNSIELLQ